MPEDLLDVKPKWNIDVEKHPKDMWSFGICLSHFVDETYIYANFYRWTISIGKFRKYGD